MNKEEFNYRLVKYVKPENPNSAPCVEVLCNFYAIEDITDAKGLFSESFIMISGD